jgi:sulfate adenylyltransferase subunit 2
MIWTANKHVYRESHEIVEEKMVRFRTVGDMTCTAAVLSEAVSLDDVVTEIRDSTISERGARIDDKRSEAAMEVRKKVGYF